MPTQADYAKIAIACKALGIDRLQLLSDRYDVESMKELTPRQLSDLYRHFRALGWSPVNKKKPVTHKEKNRKDFIYLDGPVAAQQRKVMALWKELGYEPASIHARVKKQFGVDSFRWLTDYDSLHILITDLEARLARQKYKVK